MPHPREGRRDGGGEERGPEVDTAAEGPEEWLGGAAAGGHGTAGQAAVQRLVSSLVQMIQSVRGLSGGGGSWLALVSGVVVTVLIGTCLVRESQKEEGRGKKVCTWYCVESEEVLHC